MKSIHFCTPLKLAEVTSGEPFSSIRTGWTPSCYPGDRVRIWDFNTKATLGYAQIYAVVPVLFMDLDHQKHQEEIARYKRKFHHDHWFFLIEFSKLDLFLGGD